MFTVGPGAWASITSSSNSYVYMAHTLCQSWTLFMQLQYPMRYILLFPFYPGEMETDHVAKDYVAEKWKCCFNLETLAADFALPQYALLSSHISIDKVYCA